MKLLGWTLLAALLAVLIAAASVHDRSGWPAFAGGEATHLMQAESLVYDRDLNYTRQDFDRFLLRWRGNPADLELVSGSEGGRITFDTPFPYALWLAPFLKLWPRNGFAIANALLLLWVGLAAARALSRRQPDGEPAAAAGPWLVAILVFASALFAEVFRAGDAVFLFAVTFAGFRLLARGSDASAGRPLLAGALLAIPVATEPLYGVLLAAAFFVPPPGRERPRVRKRLALGTAAVLAVIAGTRWLAAGGLPVAGDRFRFTAETGYPRVDFPASEWPSTVGRLVAGLAPDVPWDLELRAWSLVDLLAGRNIGLLPYFAPLLLIAVCGSLRGHRRAPVIAAAVFGGVLVASRPFDVTGGGAVNALFLPVYGMLWLAVDGACKPWRLWLGALLSVALSLLFLRDLWRDPGAYPAVESQGGAPVTATARRVLPFETTQRRAPSGDAAGVGDLSVRVIQGDAWVEARRSRLVLAGGRIELLVGSVRPLSAILFDFEGGPPAGLAVRGGKIDGTGAGTAGIVRIVPRGIRRRHTVPWGRQRLYLYRMSFELPEPAGPLAVGLAGESPGRKNV